MRQLHQFQGMSCFRICHSDACRNLFVDIERNGKKYTRSLHHHPIVTTISDLYKVDLPRRSANTIQGRPRASDVPPVSEIGGEIGDETTATDVSIITMTPASPVATKATATSTNRSTTRSITSISSQNIRYTEKI